MKRGDTIELRIDAVAFGGAGIGRYPLDDRMLTVFVEDTVPGDTVRARIGGKKKNYAHAYVEEFIQRAPQRVSPRCQHFGLDGDRCGGCSLQYLSYQDQLALKEQHVRDAIERIGGIDGEKVLPIIGMDDPWYYRNKMEFSFSRTPEGQLSLGLHVKRRHHDVVDLTECLLCAPYAGRFVTAVRDFFRGIDGTDGPVLKSLILREGKNTGEIMVNLIAENGEASFLDEFTRAVRAFFGEDSGLASVYYTHVMNQKGTPKRTTEKLLWGKSTIRESLSVGKENTLKFDISPQSFFQPNTKQAETLFRVAVEAAHLTGKEVVYDLYCGAGTIALACARSSRQVYGIEMNESALLNARANAALNNISHVSFEVGDTAKMLPSIPEKADIVMLDPPRSGLHEDVVQFVQEMGPKRIVYVSCNPSTLARDLALFIKTGYTLDRVQPVDMFPQTYHIENVALLERT